MQLYEQIENVPKYKNGSNAIPKDEIVIQYSAFKQSFIQFLEAECEKWIKVFDYHNDMSNERHSTMRNVARTEIEYFKKLIKEME